ncbi:unnamed protein product [Eruca vesicaria subsp. sativa]|uniref:Brf1 TBP-binding domain-containing protein n=1 Tax=Eruca vesicaria subsp. sativa TaxID=29727 RepID=A0ABC8L7E4_ERUVS|nr:unnamed protein product [Eruca vesicaria subsp. sativa]
MVENSVKPSSNDTLASRPMARNLKGVGDLAEDLSRISDAEVAGYLNTKKESLLMKIAWEMMNPEYKKETQRKPITGKKKDPVSKNAPSKKTSSTTTQINTESDKKKRLSSYVNLDVLDKLFDDENSPKRTKLEERDVGDKMEKFQESSEECLLEHEGAEEDEPVLNEDYSNEDANTGDDEEFYGDADLEYEDQDEGEDNEDIIW